jgi:hypothetical protein
LISVLCALANAVSNPPFRVFDSFSFGFFRLLFSAATHNALKLLPWFFCRQTNKNKTAPASQEDTQGLTRELRRMNYETRGKEDRHFDYTIPLQV